MSETLPKNARTHGILRNRQNSRGIHRYEEPIISGSKGSGTIFFGGCNLRCCFCQNSDISHVAAGEEYSPERLAELMVKLAKTGVHNINLVTAAHIRPLIATALTMAKPLLTIPVVYNSSGYEGDISDLDGCAVLKSSRLSRSSKTHYTANGAKSKRNDYRGRLNKKGSHNTPSGAPHQKRRVDSHTYVHKRKFSLY